ncbi:transglycosylase SLT domain-containing protein [Helicobacter saguini]|uniref:Lytic transglycosylase domain-containing protein n=2 Tax=Helicobacter saguini TaxID=1548018 RepID=A0A347W0M0_9HELI|nr:transglycosylase SLT domain-containing protein [Helicobacter saguini]MWV67474.1 transglycosylase SLT domain-containing protein [Helicobacter saguini]MWV69825.1 transglycosylase SLT domain-containing protein [Helicobacter saguini]MWV72957.1 transglycosylase SLT domain-containing protein [Helicobacter saguini]TLD95702.1 lytic transglycosylase domain-containing protein [Helicobacter saguini]
MPKPTNVQDLKGRDFFNYYIKDKPKGIVRDFYIWQYLSENKLDSKQINEVYKMLNAKNPYLRKVLNNLGKTEKLPRDMECAKMAVKTALKAEDSCLIISVKNHLAAFKTLDKATTDSVLKKIKNTHKDTARAIEILQNANRTTALFKENSIVFNMVYHALSSDEKHKITTQNPAEDFKRLSEYKTNGFYILLNNAILSSNLKNIKTLLLKADIKEAPHNTLFLLGINELRFGDKTKAMNYFERAKKATSLGFFIDRATFWQYMLSKDSKYLDALLKSKNANIFSIFASQKTGKSPGYTIISTLPSLALDNPPFDTKDPYVWQNISNTMINSSDPIKLAKVVPYFSYKDTMPHLAYLMQKIDKYATNYYITPYEGLIKWNSVEEQSFTFAIARQESYFIPTLISRSFALGIMQIMPANVKPFAKEMGRSDIEYNDLFDPKTSLEMGRHFLNVLKRQFKHPLFVAYSYNGGPGFLKRLLDKNELFLKNRDYEPWLSMELVPNEESRLYGQRVLANFIIYEKLFGKEINLENLLKETLIYHNANITK